MKFPRKLKLLTNRTYHKYIAKLWTPTLSFLRRGSNRVGTEIGLLVVLTIWAPFLGGMVPGFAQVKNISSAVEIFSVVAGSLASILGIAVAFVLLTFEFGRKYFSWQYSAKRLFSSEALRELIVVYVSTVLIAVLGLATIQSQAVSELSMRLLLLVIFLFLIAILFLIPRVRTIIQQEDATEELAGLVQAIGANDVRRFSTARDRTTDNHLAGNQLYVIIEIARRAGKEQDNAVLGLIVEHAYKRFSELTERDTGLMGQEARDFAYGFAHLYSEIARTALRQDNLRMAEVAFDYLVAMSQRYSNAKRLWHSFIELNELMESILGESLKLGLSDLAKRLIWKYERCFEEAIENNAPHESELWEFSDDLKKFKEGHPADNDLANQWGHIEHDYVGSLSKLGGLAIQRQDEEAAGTVLRSLSHCCEIAFDASNLGDKQKSRFAGLTLYLQSSLYRDILEARFAKNISFLLGGMYSSFRIKDKITERKPYATLSLQAFTSALLLTAAHDSKSVVYALNEIGATGRILKTHLKKYEDAQKATIFIAATLGEIREIVAPNLIDLDAARVYLECHKQLTSIKVWKGDQVRKVTRSLNAEIEKFTELDKAKQIYEHGAGDRWNQLFGSN